MQIFASPRHPYTRALLAAVPRLGSMQGSDTPARFPIPDTGTAAAAAIAPLRPPSSGEPLLKVRGLKTRFPVRSGLLGRVRRRVHAVEQVSFDLRAGETLALVGESGCGKSTTGRSLLRLVDIDGGSIELAGRDIARCRPTRSARCGVKSRWCSRIRSRR